MSRAARMPAYAGKRQAQPGRLRVAVWSQVRTVYTWSGASCVEVEIEKTNVFIFSMFALMISCWSVQQPCAAKKRPAGTLPTAHFTQHLGTQRLNDSARTALSAKRARSAHPRGNAAEISVLKGNTSYSCIGDWPASIGRHAIYDI